MEIHEPDPQKLYSIRAVVRMTGSSERKIIFYCRQGVVRPAAGESRESWHFDEDTVVRLRRIEALRQDHRMNWAAIRMIISLLEEVETLRQELRFRR